jgi:hypothetical protein
MIHYHQNPGGNQNTKFEFNLYFILIMCAYGLGATMIQIATGDKKKKKKKTSEPNPSVWSRYVLRLSRHARDRCELDLVPKDFETYGWLCSTVEINSINSNRDAPSSWDPPHGGRS